MVVFADCIGPMFHQETNDGEAMLLHGEMERIRVVTFAAEAFVALPTKANDRGSMLNRRDVLPYNKRTMDRTTEPS
jgi:hypothetical protein